MLVRYQLLNILACLQTRRLYYGGHQPKMGLTLLKVVSILHSFDDHIFKQVTITLSQKGNKLGCEDWTFWASFFPERYCQFYSTWTNIMPFIQTLSCYQSFFSMQNCACYVKGFHHTKDCSQTKAHEHLRNYHMQH